MLCLGLKFSSDGHISVHVCKSNALNHAQGFCEAVSCLVGEKDIRKPINAKDMPCGQYLLACLGSIFAVLNRLPMWEGSALGVRSAKVRWRSLVCRCGTQHRYRHDTGLFLCPYSVEAANKSITAYQGDHAFRHTNRVCFSHGTSIGLTSSSSVPPVSFSYFSCHLRSKTWIKHVRILRLLARDTANCKPRISCQLHNI